jgi:hypothetical protein
MENRLKEEIPKYNGVLESMQWIYLAHGREPAFACHTGAQIAWVGRSTHFADSSLSQLDACLRSILRSERRLTHEAVGGVEGHQRMTTDTCSHLCGTTE